MNGAFKRVKDKSSFAGDDLKALFVVVTTSVTGTHNALLSAFEYILHNEKTCGDSGNYL